MANPPFNIKEWWDGKLEGEARWNRSEVESASHAQFYKPEANTARRSQGDANVACDFAIYALADELYKSA